MRGLWLVVICLLPSVGFAQRGAQPPAWQLDSARDEMTDKKRIWADLPATHPITYQYGTFAPFLELICFEDTTLLLQHDGLALRVYSQVSPRFIVDGSGALMLRFDSLPAFYGDFNAHESGEVTILTPVTPFLPEDRVTRDTVLLNIGRGAQRLLVQYPLITGERVTAEFRFDQRTRPVLDRVMRACKMELPT